MKLLLPTVRRFEILVKRYQAERSDVWREKIKHSTIISTGYNSKISCILIDVITTEPFTKDNVKLTLEKSNIPQLWENRFDKIGIDLKIKPSRRSYHIRVIPKLAFF